MSVRGHALVFRPRSISELKEALQEARLRGLTVGLRGSGCSYGDAALNSNGALIDFSRMNRILAWDPVTGRLTAQPGVTIRQIWRSTVEAGWWPPVVPGTMAVSLGGAAAMNVHGKNNWKLGPIGDHILSFRMMDPDGTIHSADRSTHPDRFHAAIGGFGMLGCFTEITLQLKKVHSGQLEVTAVAARRLEEMFALFERHHASADYLVGWIDAFARGDALGRGLVHLARYLQSGEDPHPEYTSVVARQELPTRLLGIIPKGWMWRFLRPFCNNTGMAAINWAKYRAGVLRSNPSTYRQAHAAFHFLLDYVPDWKCIYKPGGLIQYQSFVPKEKAPAAFREIMEINQQEGMPSYLLVMKKHRPDPFWMTHAVDGYSMAMDFPVTAANRDRLWAMCHAMSERVIAAGGRFYFAKDSTLRPQDAESSFPRENLERFWSLKRDLDPEGRLRSDLAARIFPTRVSDKLA